MLFVYPVTDVKQTVDDYQLVEAFRGGDEKAFEELVRRYQRQVANIIYLTLGNRDEVEDLSQEVFIRVYRSLAKYERDASLYSWIYRIAVNLCIDEIRRKKIKRTLSLEFFSEGKLEEERKNKSLASAADGVLGKEKNQVVRDALQKLSPVHRTVLVLREYEDLTYEQIAKTLHISTQAVKSRIFRAREELRELLKDYFKERL
ncbi:MAG: sigma-70 family RNA polymerase sigma factor [Ignavibacteriales bacterium]|nr:sigma-70 family RNA polymerase sigma factor [Ignavibacteriales bacterium]MBI3788694.1 sigma-70 family RNA polymerase sigma factor [Ignavibacteriales bacterium]